MTKVGKVVLIVGGVGVGLLVVGSVLAYIAKRKAVETMKEINQTIHDLKGH